MILGQHKLINAPMMADNIADQGYGPRHHFNKHTSEEEKRTMDAFYFMNIPVEGKITNLSGTQIAGSLTFQELSALAP